MANEAIIRAAGQRYAQPKVDYSGYVQGVSAIAAGLIQKKKNFDKKYEAIGETYSEQLKYIDNPEVIAQLQVLRSEAYEALDDTKGLNVFSKKHKDGRILHKKRVKEMEALSIQYTRGEKLHLNIIKANKNGTVSNGEHVIDEAWWADIRDNGFEYKYMNESLHVKGPEGIFIPYSDIPKTFLTKESSSGIADAFIKNVNKDAVNFMVDYKSNPEEYEKGKSLHSVKKQYDLLMNQSIANTMILLQDDNGGVNDAFRSFSVDQRLPLPDGSGHTTFAQYYMSNPDLHGDAVDVGITYTKGGETVESTLGAFAEEFMKQNEGVLPELINKQLNIIFNDIIKNASDPNIMEDMRTFLTELYGR